LPLAVGTVTLIGPDHIGLLVNGVFNASIAAAKIPPTYQRTTDAEGTRLVHTETGEVIEAGATLEFVVTG